MGGMFGAIAILGALIQRGITGRGMEVQSALYENNIFLVGQHMLQYAITGKPAAPMPARISPWAIYDVFTVKDGEQIFLAAVSDAQWLTFCDALGFADLKADPALALNNDRVARAANAARRLGRAPEALQRGRVGGAIEAAGLPFAPIKQARGAARRSAPAGHRRPGGHPAAPTAQRRRPADGARRRCSRSRWTASGWACASIRPAAAAHREVLAASADAGAEIDALIEAQRGGVKTHTFHQETRHDCSKHSPAATAAARHCLATCCRRRRSAQVGDKTVKFILPNATGSGVDAITRAAQPALAKALGFAIVVDNQPGAGGIVGLQALAACGAGRHDAVGGVEQRRHLPERVQDDAVRHAGRLHADRGRRRHADRAGGQPEQGAGQRITRSSRRC